MGMRSTTFRSVAGCGLAGLLAVAVAAPARAEAGSAPARYCAVVLAPAAADGAVSAVLDTSCSDRSDAAAAAGLRPAADSLLMTLWEHEHYAGQSMAIYGTEGTCDTEGYTITPTSYWKTHLSSIQGGDLCDTARLYNIANSQSRDVGLPVVNIGIMNDNVGKIWVRHR